MLVVFQGLGKNLHLQYLEIENRFLWFYFHSPYSYLAKKWSRPGKELEMKYKTGQEKLDSKLRAFSDSQHKNIKPVHRHEKSHDRMVLGRAISVPWRQKSEQLIPMPYWTLEWSPPYCTPETSLLYYTQSGQYYIAY